MTSPNEGDPLPSEWERFYITQFNAAVDKYAELLGITRAEAITLLMADIEMDDYTEDSDDQP